ncbi:FAD-binding oxidoreductase [Segnochrobactraceae bacterium EtOH-i3]
MTDLSPALQALHDRFGERFSASASVREQHGRGEAHQDTIAPDAVLFPETTEEVAEIVRACVAAGLPVIPHGAGTSLEGHLSAEQGGVCVDLSRMNRVLSVNPEDLDCSVEPGVTREQLNAYLRDQGLFFPVDPGANASIGGMTSTRASGTNAVRYGTMRENVLSLTVVLPDGRIVRTARRARKSAAGYDLTHLFIGAEGTLGIITEITLRLYGIPETISAALCHFPDVDDAVGAAISIIQLGIPVARMELMDRALVGAVNSYSHTALAQADTLAFEFHGAAAIVEEQVAMVREIVAEHGGADFQWATSAEDRAKLWKARHHAFYAVIAQRPGCKGWSSDVCVPVSKLGECIHFTRELLSRSAIPAFILGHVGDGNYHVVFAVDPACPSELEEVAAINRAMVEKAISVDGTCTGEHGIGTGKIGYMRAEHGDVALELMAALKHAVDPRGLMNPGKILPPSNQASRH